MTNTNYSQKFSFWASVLAVLGFFFLSFSTDILAAPKRNVNFDHVKTGFPLTGGHATLPCETCHVQGAFKGTPKKCATCHTQGSRILTTTFKSPNHIATTLSCDQCHTSTASWNVAFFSHAGVTPHQCRQCHNNTIVKGKPANHIVTNEPCDACHRTSTWGNTSFSHDGVVPGQCDSCHRPSGRASTFKPSNHIPTDKSCDACHTTGGSFSTSKFTHTATQGVVAGQCSTCHNGSFTQWNALGKTSNHVSTTASCDTCHKGFVSFAGVSGSAFNHAGVTPGSCATCHVQGGSAKTFKPTDHIPTNKSCDTCHTTGGTFTTTSFAHSATQGVAAGLCSTCHNGSFTKWNALGKTSNHIPTTLSCDACHTAGGAFKPSRFTHAATQGVAPLQCATCHNGAYTSMNALGKPSNHVVTTASCDTCHTGYVSFAGVTGSAFNHSGVSPGACATCHTQGGSGMAKPSDHIPTTLSCDACHTTGGTFTTSRFTHSSTQGITAGQCSTCHNGSYTKWNALSKPSNHIPTTGSCDACHTTGGTFTTSTFTHSATQSVVAGQCANCHNGSYTQWNALGKTPTHVATTASCDTCHKSYTSFTGATFSHATVSPGSCASCHTQGGSATGKPADHIPTNLSCDACHTTGGTFTTSRFTHSATQGIIAGQCSTCHNGSYVKWNAQSKPSNHIPTTASCDACHTTGGTFTTSTFTHSATQSVLPGQCATCHNGSYTQWNALGKTATHLVTTASCDSCHKNYTSFAGAAFSHTGVSPGTCATCHFQGGSGMAKPNNHIPYESQLLAGASLSCDACHTSTTTFTAQRMNHNNSLGNGAGWCKGCHASGTTFLGSMQKKSLSHYERYQGQTDCSSSGCHRPLGTQGTPYTRWTN